MWAVQEKAGAPLWFSLLIFLLWCAVMGSYLTFVCHVAPRALKRWAMEHRYKIVQKRQAWLIKRAFVAASNVQMVYEVVIIDEFGKTRSGLIKIGTYWWPKLSVVNCPVEVYLDNSKKPDGWLELKLERIRIKRNSTATD
jgi:hypothetical protein